MTKRFYLLTDEELSQLIENLLESIDTAIIQDERDKKLMPTKFRCNEYEDLRSLLRNGIKLAIHEGFVEENSVTTISHLHHILVNGKKSNR